MAADGGAAERRILFALLRRLFPNVVLAIRDVAHAVRIACKEPLHHDTVFGQVWGVLFDERHAVVPDICNSTKWRAILEAVQADIITMNGDDAPMQRVLKYLSFAKQRFDSYADPVARVALMILPI